MYSEEGQLQVKVFGINSSVPISNALVKVTQRGNEKNIISEEITDESGQCPILNLPTPPLKYSLSPEQEKPFSEFDVIILKEGYSIVKIEGVQIFPNTFALQSVFLRPFEIVEMQNIFINEPVLWGTFPPKIKEDLVKELPSSLGLVVLPKPVVPEFIIVHDGVPTNSKAKNYTVTFKDYIKNVASCEIYSTWETEAIKANILAILSFTLNRVYTEWYRNKGYNFTITSSTAYDHAFNYGRNIYKEISVLVDELFTTFITKPGIRQPLFAQYCDGKKVSCPNWLSQWGAQDLAAKGFNAVDILKKYYGSEIYLMAAEKVAGVPSSFSGTNLQMGSFGPDVRIIQEQLNEIGNNYPALRKINIDGMFGNQTRIAVETFQEIFKLPSSGIVNFATWYRISDIYVGVSKIAELK